MFKELKRFFTRGWTRTFFKYWVKPLHPGGHIKDV
jgi:hypothetical protein